MNKKTMKKGVLSTHHPSMVVHGSVFFNSKNYPIFQFLEKAAQRREGGGWGGGIVKVRWKTYSTRCDGPNCTTSMVQFTNLNLFRVLLNSNNDCHQSCQQAKFQPSKEPSYEEVIFFFASLFRTKVVASCQKELLLVFCSHQVFPLMYALLLKPCLCSLKKQKSIVVHEMFLQHA